MNLKKKAQVIILPTSNATIGTIMKYTKYSPLHDAVIDKEVGQLVLNKNTNVTKTNEYWEAQSLHIVNDSVIKEPCYAYCKSTNTIQWLSEIQVKFLKKDNWSKVIVSTDKSLNLPSPSEQFIQKYVESYNKGNVISEVNIDYQEYYMSSVGDKFIVNKDLYGLSKGTSLTIKSFNFKNDPNLIEFEEDVIHNQGIHISHTNIKTEFLLKVDSKNQVTITRCKDSWNREEVIKLIEEFYHISCNGEYDDGGEFKRNKFNKWIKENL